MNELGRSVYATLN